MHVIRIIWILGRTKISGERTGTELQSVGNLLTNQVTLVSIRCPTKSRFTNRQHQLKTTVQGMHTFSILSQQSSNDGIHRLRLFRVFSADANRLGGWMDYLDLGCNHKLTRALRRCGTSLRPKNLKSPLALK